MRPEAKGPAAAVLTAHGRPQGDGFDDAPDRASQSKEQRTHRLNYGRARRLVVEVVPDGTLPAMFRVRWPNADVSPPANLARCMDAARAWAERGPPRRDPRGIWEWQAQRINHPRGPIRAPLSAVGRAEGFGQQEVRA